MCRIRQKGITMFVNITGDVSKNCFHATALENLPVRTSQWQLFFFQLFLVCRQFSEIHQFCYAFSARN
ncbi:MAG: hypothetical protein EZS28_052548 [Streblomastix strix]|uniref:Uncharacterized protein n=1 Tax=Streblomastix strix TaxID=222440 RepID=A0A5J4S284_9EUKA|nr:MAG: hypothetical protein EZS28_052548 [Streblomastix strix]